MPLMEKYGYRTLLKTVPKGEVFDPDDDAKSGLIDLTEYGGSPEALALFVPHVLVSWSMMGDRNKVASVFFRFEDPESGALIVPVDESGSTYSEFTWPDGGPGFPVPIRNDLQRTYLMKLTTAVSGDDGQAWTVQLWWEPRFPGIDLQEAIKCFGADAVRCCAAQQSPPIPTYGPRGRPPRR